MMKEHHCWLFITALLTMVVPTWADPSLDDLGPVAREALTAVRPALARVEVTARDGSGMVAQTAVRVGQAGEWVTTLWGLDPEPAAILVEWGKGIRLPAQIIGRDRRRSIALLRVRLPSDDSQGWTSPAAVPVREMRVGQWAFAVGQIWPENPSISAGILSATERVWGRAIQIDAKTSALNYGGPVIDRAGRVLGIITPLDPLGQRSTSSPSIYDSGVGFAVPLEQILADLPRLRQGDIFAGESGISFSTPGQFLEPALIARIAWRSPADQAGLRPGDIIIRVGQNSILRQGEFGHAMGNASAGDPVKLSVRRGTSTFDANLSLVATLPIYRWPSTGFLARNASKGIEVIGVVPGSSADKEGIRPQQTITKLAGKAVNNLAELRAILDQRGVGEKLSLEVRSSSGLMNMNLLVEEGMKSVPPRPTPKENQTNPIDSSFAREQGQGNDFWIRMPRRSSVDEKVGLLFCLEAGPAARRVALLKAWEKTCDREGLALAGMEPIRAGRWSFEDLPRASRVLDELLKRQAIDPARVVVHGAFSSTGIAHQFVSIERERVRGMLLVGRSLGPTRPMQPAEKLAVALIDGADPRVQVPTRISSAWESLGYPVLPSMEVKEGYLSAEQVELLGRWTFCIGHLF
ncbi:PDZ domain-containing protein [bacterium]|nr:PDZ domain-containing protein [bacterium]